MNECKTCKAKFQPVAGKEWATQCFDCWKKDKDGTEATTQPESKTLKSNAMFVSYAKDIFIALLSSEGWKATAPNTLMAMSIELVKTARNSL